MPLKNYNKMGQSAAVAVEAAMVIGIFLTTIFVLATFTVAAFRYSILADATAHTLRIVSIDASAGYANCAALKNDFNQKAKDYITNTFATDGNDPSIYFDVFVRRYTNTADDCRATIQVIAQWETPGILRHFLSIGNLQIVQSREIEDTIFRKCGNCMGCPLI